MKGGMVVGRGSANSAEIGCHARSRADDMSAPGPRAEPIPPRKNPIDTVRPHEMETRILLSAVAMTVMRHFASGVR